MASEQPPTQPESEMATINTALHAEQLPAIETNDQSNTSSQNQAPSNQEAESTSQTPQPPPKPRLQALANKKSQLESTLSDLQSQKDGLISASTLPSGLAMPSTWSEEEKVTSALGTANGIIKDHISLLHKYNEIKDIAQGLMGLIAESRGVRMKVVMEEYGMGDGD